MSRPATLASLARRKQIEAQADAFLRAHGSELFDRGSDVAAISLDFTADGEDGDEFDAREAIEARAIEAHGSWIETDLRYVAMRAKYAAAADPEQRRGITIYPAAGDSISGAEHAELVARAQELIERGAGSKPFRNLLQRIVDGGRVTSDQLREWLPKIEAMRKDGRGW